MCIINSFIKIAVAVVVIVVVVVVIVFVVVVVVVAFAVGLLAVVVQLISHLCILYLSSLKTSNGILQFLSFDWLTRNGI